MLYVNGKEYKILETYYRTEHLKHQSLFSEEIVNALELEHVYRGRRFHKVKDAKGKILFCKEFFERKELIIDEVYITNMFKDLEYVVKIMDYDDSKILFEYIDGYNLSKIGFFVPNEHINKVFEKLVEFLELLIENEMHGLFELHPNNVLITSDGFKIIDFETDPTREKEFKMKNVVYKAKYLGSLYSETKSFTNRFM